MPSSRFWMRHLPETHPRVRHRQSHRLGVMGATLVWLMEPPCRMRTKTPQRFDPPDPVPDADVVGRFRAGQNRLRDFISRCQGRQLERTSIVSPFNASVRYSVYAALRILAAHQRRHLWQARRVREVNLLPLRTPLRGLSADPRALRFFFPRQVKKTSPGGTHPSSWNAHR